MTRSIMETPNCRRGRLEDRMKTFLRVMGVPCPTDEAGCGKEETPRRSLLTSTPTYKGTSGSVPQDFQL